MTPLHGLLPSVRTLLDENFRNGSLASIDAAAFIVNSPLEREIDIAPLLAMVDEAMERFKHAPDKSDQWLAPRVHACLRLHRREAADKRVWHYLNIVAKPDYVRWRFGEQEGDGAHAVAIDRFMGEDSKNALGRLWWAAELTRNGADYGETVQILKTSRFFTSWQPLDAMHHRPAALAICRFAREFNDGAGLTDSQSQRLAKAFNLRLSTLALDALATNPAIDSVAVEEWCNEPVDETKYFDELPNGPDEEPVADEAISAVFEVLATLAGEIDLAEFKRVHRKPEAQPMMAGTSELAE
ncbi:MAG: hypothetical protein KF708_06875 [Pirellulales bacterium]|nr:hypothetical protein [Pirellulales bacterium]